MTADREHLVAQASSDFLDALLDDDPTELYENAPCGYVSTLLDGTIVKANQTFLAWMRLSRAEAVGRLRVQDLFAIGDRVFYETHVAPMLRMQGRAREIAVDLDVRGARLPVLANAVVKRDADGEPQLIRTVFFDARERRAYERELVAARQRAEDAEARAREFAQTLQSTFLPPLAVTIPGLDFAGAYRPAGDGTVVGGDFFDVFPTGGGGHAVVLGDVSGKGVDAAVVAALVRHVVRAETTRIASPSEVFGAVHTAMQHAHPERFCTALLLEVTPGSPTHCRLAVAGHQLPIITDGDRARRVGRPGSILGLIDDIETTDVDFELADGEVLVLYTDGVSEARSPQGFFGDELVAELARAQAGAGAAAVADAITAAAVEFQGGVARDDIAVVVLRRPT